jgi:hypothetical protein
MTGTSAILEEHDGSEVAERESRPVANPLPSTSSEQAVWQKSEAGHPLVIKLLLPLVCVVLILGLVITAAVGRGILGETRSEEQVYTQSAIDTRALDRLEPQRQAETLLELALGHSAGAVEQISAHMGRWQGKVQWNPQIASLTTAALNSDDMHVRESGVEVELAAYGLGKNRQSLDYVLHSAASNDHARKIWALWALGLMANRGVQPDSAVNTLAAHLHDADEDSRMWAVEGLALSGTEPALRALLRTMHDDPSGKVREAAAAGLAQSGMFSPEQKITAVPLLVHYTDDPSLDAATHTWALHALADITHERLGDDAAAWKRWYGEQAGSDVTR